MFRIDGYAISLTRGDTATLEITFTGDAPTANDQVITALKKNANRKSAIWEKTIPRQPTGEYLLDIASEDTEDLQPGDYWWDIRILYEDGQITTPFSPAAFHVLEVVTNLPETEGDGG